ncbi:centromere/microtubule-binding protein [Thermoplasma volcanium GSS1]|uniref:Probable tRNA pseudouridine synthase B n=1 Tax=Thermoplasma volcanium (strain ATCC 51530 / DSM 4299 / JCM 9571 / NBRC 15438 / GSS1) TaxID=273116 RepID=TRUB_THEVO|nr:RNA-guided pseudouridylation complex pseudouridine synthase subunit Cbf5 [Thermoplasma volcanium]Q97BU9.1 RecName: Full=Probable tRNA pseudouridine synthase B; AltName: Full=tRNA pseudouridine(55) synthase; Short=Psi55 synthase; AltName: Full=tRNA pseudouridylate synthase; AltName: Full=tRNA-uridine isomerase [Thermoplasma volcanium GSS1]BAB59498.1 centromere/microtubule-binding protein [Thermoplasma volcanium GSS1]
MIEEIQKLNGFIVIDKPQGPTSHQVDYWVRQILGTEKVGHIGTLDPNVTGVLVMAIGKAVRLIDVVHEKPKEYVGVMRFHSDISEEEVREVFRKFTTRIYQLPPVRSAVSRKVRIKTIYELDMIEKKDKIVLFHVKCESGTYIRTLCTDIGYVSGKGGQMVDLRRISTGPFKEDIAITLQDLQAYVDLAKEGKDELFRSHFLDMTYAFIDYPKIVAKKSAVENIAHGSDLYVGGVKLIDGNFQKGDRVCVLSEDNELLGTGIARCDSSNLFMKVVDFDHIFVEAKHGKGDVVRDREKDVQRPGQQVHRNIRDAAHGPDSRTGRGRKETGPQIAPNRVRKLQNKTGVHRRPGSH